MDALTHPADVAPTAIEPFVVLIVGAGISGIGDLRLPLLRKRRYRRHDVAIMSGHGVVATWELELT
jgi:hypothetical protein